MKTQNKGNGARKSTLAPAIIILLVVCCLAKWAATLLASF